MDFQWCGNALRKLGQLAGSSPRSSAIVLCPCPDFTGFPGYPLAHWQMGEDVVDQMATGEKKFRRRRKSEIGGRHLFGDPSRWGGPVERDQVPPPPTPPTPPPPRRPVPYRLHSMRAYPCTNHPLPFSQRVVAPLGSLKNDGTSLVRACNNSSWTPQDFQS